jgi:RNA polymerase sigma factor (sigma-70 family)
VISSPTDNERRFQILVYRYRHRVFSFACYYLGDPDDAEDVAQEVLLRLWKYRDGIDETRVLGWLLRVTRNACIDAARRRRSLRDVISTDDRLLESALDGESLPDAETEQAEFQDCLRQAVAQLPDPHRSIVILREIHDMKYDEISAAMDLPLNTVKVYLHRARKMLRELLNPVLEREAA